MNFTFKHLNIKSIVIIAIVICLLLMPYLHLGYSRKTLWLNLPFLFSVPLILLFIAVKAESVKNMLMIVGALLVLGLYINLLPDGNQTLPLAFVHLPVLLWAIGGYVYVNGDIRNPEKFLNYVRYFFRLIWLSGILVVVIGLLALTTSIVGFSFSWYNSEVFLFVFAPIGAFWLLHSKEQFVNEILRISYWIGLSLALIPFCIYLAPLFYFSDNPFSNISTLKEVNVLLKVLEMGIIVLLLQRSGKALILPVLQILIAVTTVVVSIALAAIIYRIANFGITPVRLVTVGQNLLIVFLLYSVGRPLLKKGAVALRIQTARNALLGYSYSYIAWALIVVFIFPVVFLIFFPYYIQDHDFIYYFYGRGGFGDI